MDARGSSGQADGPDDPLRRLRRHPRPPRPAGAPRPRRSCLVGTARAEVDVFAGHFEGEDGLAWLAVVNVSVPSGESDLAWLDPREVFDRGGIVQTVDCFRFKQRTWAVSDKHDAPWSLHRQRAYDQ